MLNIKSHFLSCYVIGCEHITTKPSLVGTSLFINYFTKKVLYPTPSAKNTVLDRAASPSALSDPRWASHIYINVLLQSFLFVQEW